MLKGVSCGCGATCLLGKNSQENKSATRKNVFWIQRRNQNLFLFAMKGSVFCLF
jgi:hypothetical protein